jgi:hypothetical protein
MNNKGKFALKQSKVMLQRLKTCKRNGLIDPKQADRLIEDLENSMQMAEKQLKNEEKTDKTTKKA